MNGTSDKGAVAAGHLATARAATRILNDGGNAFDATLAALATACVCEPVLASPGGGGFLMAVEAGSANPVLIDFFGHSPREQRTSPDDIEFASVFADFGTARQEFHVGRGATSTPGFIPGLTAIHDRFATLPLCDLMAPAISLARGGVEVTPFQAFLFDVVSPILIYSPSVRSLFAPDDTLLKSGDLLANPGLADFFEMVGQKGAEFCVTGAGAEAVLEGQEEYGHLTALDLAHYRVEVREPLKLELKDCEIFLNPPPSAGGAMIAAMLDGINRSGLDRADAMARADRLRNTHDGDPRAILASIGFEPGTAVADAGPSTRGTTHVSVIDAAGNAAAATVSNGEGSGHMAGPFGFMPNNLLGEADLMPHGFHRWRPDARLASNMAPSLLRHADGRIAALGSGGSNRIRTAVFQVVTRLVRDGLDPQTAVEAARLHIEDGHLDFEDLIDDTTRKGLTDRFPDHRAWPGHNLFFGGCHVVERASGGAFTGAGDPRRAGVCLLA